MESFLDSLPGLTFACWVVYPLITLLGWAEGLGGGHSGPPERGWWHSADGLEVSIDTRHRVWSFSAVTLAACFGPVFKSAIVV